MTTGGYRGLFAFTQALIDVTTSGSVSLSLGVRGTRMGRRASSIGPKMGARPKPALPTPTGITLAPMYRASMKLQWFGVMMRGAFRPRKKPSCAQQRPAGYTSSIQYTPRQIKMNRHTRCAGRRSSCVVHDSGLCLLYTRIVEERDKETQREGGRGRERQRTVRCWTWVPLQLNDGP